MGKILHDKKEGYSFVSDNNIIYDLLEGKSLGGSTTSDIVFVMLSNANFNYDEYDNEVYDEFTDAYGEINKCAAWFYGAGFVDNEHFDFLGNCERYVNDFEKENSEMIRFIIDKDNDGMINKIKKTVEAYLVTNEDVLQIKDKIDLEKQIDFLNHM